jgi:hypothetical protein
MAGTVDDIMERDVATVAPDDDVGIRNEGARHDDR